MFFSGQQLSALYNDMSYQVNKLYFGCYFAFYKNTVSIISFIVFLFRRMSFQVVPSLISSPFFSSQRTLSPQPWEDGTHIPWLKIGQDEI